MRRIGIYISIVFMLIAGQVFGKEYYWVEFVDKGCNTYSITSPEDYLSADAIERRQMQHIEIDSLDLPVYDEYIHKVVDCGVEYVHQSKWLNGITICARDTNNCLAAIRELDFVRYVEHTHSTSTASILHNKYGIGTPNMLRVSEADTATWAVSDVTAFQNELIGVDWLIDLGFRGHGKRIAVLDTGFPYIDTDTTTLYNIKGTFNIAYPELSVFDPSLHNHGALCLGAMGCSVSGGDWAYHGVASEADYWLFATEIEESESRLETDHWVRALEMADSIGVDIVSSSLGYSLMDDDMMSYRYSDMDGKTVRCSRAASIATKKGMVVCVSSGNEANKPWHYITSPADAEGVISVGGVTVEGQHSIFSSFGPTSDGRIKPTVCAMGSAVALHNNGTINYGNGTSFAAPQIAAGVAALWASMPNKSATEISEAIVHTASLWTNPNDSMGYGIANFREAYKFLSHKHELNYSVVYESNQLVVETKDEQVSIRIFDMLGREVMFVQPARTQCVDISRLPMGAYILRIGDLESLKFIRY